MKINILILLMALLTSCHSSNNAAASKVMADTLALVGNDKDEKGCIASAGYKWSQLRNDCIRPFEDGVTLDILNSANTYHTGAYILIDSMQKKAEIFVPQENESFILDQANDTVYTNGKFNLTRENFCWTLSLNDIKLYKERQ